MKKCVYLLVTCRTNIGFKKVSGKWERFYGREIEKTRNWVGLNSINIFDKTGSTANFECISPSQPPTRRSPLSLDVCQWFSKRNLWLIESSLYFASLSLFGQYYFILHPDSQLAKTLPFELDAKNEHIVCKPLSLFRFPTNHKKYVVHMTP